MTLEKAIELKAAVGRLMYSDKKDILDYNALIDFIESALRSVPTGEPLTLEQLREMKDEPAYLNVFDPLLKSGWHIIKAVTEDKIIFRGWQTVYAPIDGMGIDYNLYAYPPAHIL